MLDTNSPLLWGAFCLLVLFLLALDLGVLHRKEKEISVKSALLTSLFYIILALIFAAGVYQYIGEQAGYEFLTGYLIEKSLSLDNIFVFVLIFNHFAVPKVYQHRVLFWGILGALFFRAVMILAGSALLAEFHGLIYVFGAFLVFTGIKMLLAADAEPDMENNKIVALMKRLLPVTDTYHGKRFFVRIDGKRFVTPLFVVLILVEITDIIFAVDSIPAIFAITQDPFIVFTSNVFAILGLRALYFALAAIIHRFHYLKYGLSVILVLIGSKMLINTYYHAKIIPTDVALYLTALIIAGSMALSLFKTRGSKAEPLHGWVPGSSDAATPDDKKDS